MKPNRMLLIDFEQYAGDDLPFKNEIISLMIVDLLELEQSYNASVEQNNPLFLRKAIHKIHTTMTMLDDQELTNAIKDLKDSMERPAAISHYVNIREEVIASLLAAKS